MWRSGRARVGRVRAGRGPYPRRLRGQELCGRMKFAIAGIIIGLILFIVSPWLAIGVIILAIGIPTGMYLMLDPSQRRRLKDIRRRRQIGGWRPVSALGATALISVPALGATALSCDQMRPGNSSASWCG